jgi:hypothetical protein
MGTTRVAARRTAKGSAAAAAWMATAVGCVVGREREAEERKKRVPLKKRRGLLYLFDGRGLYHVLYRFDWRKKNRETALTAPFSLYRTDYIERY